jgi:hypothetical protein
MEILKIFIIFVYIDKDPEHDSASSSAMMLNDNVTVVQQGNAFDLTYFLQISFVYDLLSPVYFGSM